MEKLIYLVWDRPSRPAADVRAQLLDDLGPRLLACSPRGLQIDVDDEHAQVPAMVALPDDELPVRALVSIWVDMHDTRAEYESILAAAGCGAPDTSSRSRCTATMATTAMPDPRLA